MTQPTLAALGDDGAGPLHLNSTSGSLSEHTGASPDVLRELHADWVCQLRGHVIGWSVVAAGSIILWRIAGGASGGSFVLLLGLMTLQWARAVMEWQRARKIDPIAAGSADAVGATAREREMSLALQRLMLERGARATWAIAGILIAVGAIEWLTAGNVMKTVARAGLIKPLLSEGEWWRLATAAFVHANLWHLTANLAALVAVGRIVEACTPRPWLFLTYAVAGVAGNLASWWVTPHASSLGASGAVMGVMGFLLVLGWRRPGDVPKAVRERVWMAIIATGYIGALSFGLIDNGAHAGGLIAGAVVGLIAVPRKGSQIAGASGAWLPALGAISVVAIAAGAVQATVALADGSSAFKSLRRVGPDTVVPIRSVSAAIGRDDAGWFVEITNRSSQVLEAYEITIGSPAGIAHMRRDDCCFAASEPGPVRPGAAVRVRLDTIRSPERLGRRATFSLAIFSDGSFEGSGRARDILVGRRAQAANEAAFWIAAIDKITAGPPAVAARRLMIYRDARSTYDDVSLAALSAFGIPELIKTAEHEPARFADAAAATRTGIVASRDLLALRLAQPRTAR